MKTGTLPAVSNKATWRARVRVTERDTGELVDLETDVEAITVKLRDPDTQTEVLTASLADGTITVVDTGIFEFVFTADQMGGLSPKTYEVGNLIVIDGETKQLLLGYVPVAKGL